MDGEGKKTSGTWEKVGEEDVTRDKLGMVDDETRKGSPTGMDLLLEHMEDVVEKYQSKLERIRTTAEAALDVTLMSRLVSFRWLGVVTLKL